MKNTLIVKQDSSRKKSGLQSMSDSCSQP